MTMLTGMETLKRITGLLLSGVLLLTTGCTTLVENVNEDPIRMNPRERTWGSWLDDQTIETVAAVNINKADPGYNRSSRVKVVSFNGIVLLVGQVPDERLKNLAGETAKKVNQVRQVYNELTVEEYASLVTQSNDSWLTTKIKTGLISNDQVTADRIKINTEKGTVYLMGMVTPKEAQIAVEVARGTRGVQKVVKVFEYIP
ncbi:MAG: BON domain-containing protein [Endozoicomonas sp.]